MAVSSLARSDDRDKLRSREYWVTQGLDFVLSRKGLAGSRDGEFIAGYLDGFRGVYAKAEKVDGETWVCWFVTPGQGKAQRIVQKLMPGLYVDHEGNVFEFEGRWVLILGTVVRLGSEPLLSLDALRR